MEEPQTGREKRRYRRGALSVNIKRRGRPGFIVIFEEANQFLLVCNLCAKVKSNAFRIVRLQTIKEAFVIAEVETFLL